MWLVFTIVLVGGTTLYEERTGRDANLVVPGVALLLAIYAVATAWAFHEWLIDGRNSDIAESALLWSATPWAGSLLYAATGGRISRAAELARTDDAAEFTMAVYRIHTAMPVEGRRWYPGSQETINDNLTAAAVHAARMIQKAGGDSIAAAEVATAIVARKRDVALATIESYSVLLQWVRETLVVALLRRWGELPRQSESKVPERAGTDGAILNLLSGSFVAGAPAVAWFTIGSGLGVAEDQSKWISLGVSTWAVVGAMFLVDQRMLKEMLRILFGVWDRASGKSSDS